MHTREGNGLGMGSVTRRWRAVVAFVGSKFLVFMRTMHLCYERGGWRSSGYTHLLSVVTIFSHCRCTLRSYLTVANRLNTPLHSLSRYTSNSVFRGLGCFLHV